ncbi:ABC transporter ATP-binding protein [Halopiger goleimassiliensis]|uniref:ABC transporter ATP-binding protein n=1 Tax=Halopiger goleimassiliensis TaxID=1293048 RepID=UPI000677B0AE|nr:ABC transporter ATP-binding protein [Halopiger goleimassiliensis]
MSGVALDSRGVRKTFDGDRVLEGTDLTVREGELLVLMGPNGVGKTVLLSILAGSERPSDGTVEAFGEPVDDGGRDSLGFMLQDSVAVETLTGRENVAFYGGLRPAFTDRWREYVDTLGIEDDLADLVEQYSEGMKRKLEFALTMSEDVPLYLLDEPTAGVDLTNVQRFHDVVLERLEAGATVLLSSHRPIDATVADRIAFMPDGRISAVGDPDALLADLPPVVRISGREAMVAAEDVVLEGALFSLGGEARGFLPDDDALEELRAAADGSSGTTVSTVEPNYTDLFNYHVHVRP